MLSRMTPAWEPDATWRPLPGSPGLSGAAVWLAEIGGRECVVKRLTRPEPGDRSGTDPGFVGYWRREAEVALAPATVSGPGLIAPETIAVEEDDEGVTVITVHEAGVPPTGLLLARAMGRFAGSSYDVPGWGARSLLADRLGLAEQRGGWPTLARTTLADVTDRLWHRRAHWLGRCAEGPMGRMHGDAVPANFLATRGSDVVATDWQCFGIGPVGTDLGYYALSSREEFDVLLEAYLAGVALESSPDPDAVALAARVTAAYSVITRAEWALAQAARGEGALAGKFRHPAVAPHLRALQRQFPQIEPLLR